MKSILNSKLVLTACSLFVCISTLLLTQGCSPTHIERPNIVWLVTEDNSKHFLKHYEPAGVSMPNIEKLAENGITFNFAFSNAPVCSVARSTIISGCYAPRVGAQYHRRAEFVPMPEGVEMFPSYLRKVGYYTTNNSKQDYNFEMSDEVWDESSNSATYGNRKAGQPFFHVQNFGITHEGQLHFTQEEMMTTSTSASPDSITPFPYHPNTPTFRYTYALYQQLHQQADDAIGRFIEQLEKDGLMDDTFIFYYGDHGGVLPRSKGYLYESGLHVPMVVYVPEKWKHLVPLDPGSRTDAFVQFIDLAPTVLKLAGVDVPGQMDGNAFLGNGITSEELEKRNTTFSYADRFDEKYDLVRAIRKGNLKYIRNYQPFNIDALHNFYRYRMLAYQEWEQLFQEGKLDTIQSQFFLSRSPEVLYDLEKDPHEILNLANDPAYQSELEELRKELQQQVKTMPDLSFLPEPYMVDKGFSNPVEFGQRHKEEIAALIDLADLSLLSYNQAKTGIQAALDSENPWKRYWGLIVCSAFGGEAEAFYQNAKNMAEADDVNLVRIRAVEFLGLNQHPIDTALIADILANANTEVEANLILNTVALFKSVVPNFKMHVSKDDINPDWVKDQQDLVNVRIEFINK